MTWKGEPVVGAEIAFESAEGKGGEAYGTTGEGGVYILNYGNAQGLPTGKYTVSVTYHTLPNGKPLPDGEAGSALKSEEGKTRIRCYEFNIVVTEAPRELNFELNEGKERAD